jgi:ribonuclease-3
MSVFRRLFLRDDASLQIDRQAVEQLLEMHVGNLALYQTALTHRPLFRGSLDPNSISNERLEFLGDAVLGLVVADHLYRLFPDRNEGFLTRLRAKLVNGKSLAKDALELGLGELVLMSDVMDTAEGRSSRSILADAFEAIIGAIYLDKGIDEAIRFIEGTVLKDVDLSALANKKDNYKSALLELAQAQKWPQPTYRVSDETGPSHDRTFTVEVIVNNSSHGSGTARNKKQAEQAAARMALDTLLAQLEDLADTEPVAATDLEGPQDHDS